MGRDGVTRRGFFSTVVAFIAALCGRRDTTLSAAVATPENTTIFVPPDYRHHGPPLDLNAKGWSDAQSHTAQAYCFYDEGHLFYVGLRHFHYSPQFSRDAFALVSEPAELADFPFPFERDAPFTTEPSGNIRLDPPLEYSPHPLRFMSTYDPELGRHRNELVTEGWATDPQLLKLKAQKQHELAREFAREAYDVATGDKRDHLVASAEEIERAFDELNRMIDRWAAEPWKR